MISFKDIRNNFDTEHDLLKSSANTQEKKRDLERFDKIIKAFTDSNALISAEVKGWKKGKEFKSDNRVTLNLSEDILIPQEVKKASRHGELKIKVFNTIIKVLKVVEAVTFVSFLIAPLTILATSNILFAASTMILMPVIFVIAMNGIEKLEEYTTDTGRKMRLVSSYKANFPDFIERFKVDCKKNKPTNSTKKMYLDINKRLDTKIHKLYIKFAKITIAAEPHLNKYYQLK